MKNKYLSLLLLALLFTGCIKQNPYKAVCRIKLNGYQGSGTLIRVSGDKALVLSCRHVGQKAGNACTVDWPSTGESTQGLVVLVVPGNSFDSDLSLIVCERPAGIEPAEVGKFSEADGPWTAAGYVGSSFYESFTFTAEEKGTGAIKVEAPYMHGMSGGPEFDGRGKIVGVVVGSDLHTYGLAADGKYLQDLMEILK